MQEIRESLQYSCCKSHMQHIKGSRLTSIEQHQSTPFQNRPSMPRRLVVLGGRGSADDGFVLGSRLPSLGKPGRDRPPFMGPDYSDSHPSPMQRLQHRLGMEFRDTQEGAGGAFGPAVALLPVLEGAGSRDGLKNDD